MAQTCIPKEITDLIKKQVPSKTLRQISLEDKEKRTQAITEIVDEFYKNNLLANEGDRIVVQQGIEKKIVETQKERLTKAAEYKRNVEAVGRKEPDTFLDKINQISSIDDFSDELIQEGVEIKLGARLTGDEIKKLIDASEDIGQYLDGNNNLSPEAFDTNGIRTKEFGEAYKNYQQTINNVNPSSFGEKFVSTLNANLLFNTKSGLTNIISNTGFALTGSADRTLEFGTPYKMDQAFKEAIEDAKFFSQYGFDATRSINIDAGVNTLGETMNAFNMDGSLVEKIAGQYNDLVYKQLLSTPDQFYAAFAKRDTIYRQARNEIVKSNPNIKVDSEQFNKIFDETVKDALSLNPLTPTGSRLKEVGIAEANRVTFQAQTDISKFSIQARKSLDEFSKKAVMFTGIPEDIADGFKLGTYAVPFAMTPANVINTGLDYSGIKTIVAIPKGVINGIKSAKDGATANQIILDFAKDIEFSKPAVGIAASFAIASLISPDDYIGRYPSDPDEQRLIELGRASENSIRVKIPGTDEEKWVSLDYLGPIAAPLIGILQLKKQPDLTVGQIALSLVVGAGFQLAKLPVIEGIDDLIKFSTKSIQDTINQEYSPQEFAKDFLNGLTGFIAARSVPSIVGDIGEATDEVKRDAKTGVYSIANINLDPFVIKIPEIAGIFEGREALPAKLDVFGQEIKTEGVSQIFFGSRVKTPSEDKVVLELEKMKSEGETKTPTDYIGKSAQRYYNIPNDKVPEEKREYGNQVYDSYKEIIESSDWNSLTLEDKIDALSDAEASVRKSYKNILEEKYGEIEKPE
jgi:hypothetical protein